MTTATVDTILATAPAIKENGKGIERIASKRSANSIDIRHTVVLTNHRETREKKAQLKAQIADYGRIHTAIKGYFDGANNRFVVTSGRGRRECLLELLAENVEVSPIVPIESVSAPKSDDDHAELLLMEVIDNDSEEMKPIEMGKISKQLIERYGKTQATIAARWGVSEALIGQYIRLLDQPEDVQDMIEDGKIAATEAAKVIQIHKAKAPEVIREMVADAELNNKADKNGVKKATAKNRKAVEANLTVKSEAQTALEASISTVLEKAEKKVSKNDLLKQLYQRLIDSAQFDQEDESEGTIPVSKEILDEIGVLLNS